LKYFDVTFLTNKFLQESLDEHCSGCMKALATKSTENQRYAISY